VSTPSLAEIAILLKEATTQRIVGEFLRGKEIPHTFKNWDTLVEERLQPAIDKGDLTIDQLVIFLDEVEDFGRFHVLHRNLVTN
jgi:hypothetical protein